MEQFKVIVSEHYELLFKFAMSLTRGESEARALTQETFYVWATTDHSRRDIANIKVWLFATMRRRFSLRRNLSETAEAPEDVAELPAFCPEVVKQLDWEQMLSALAEVDEQDQPAVALFYFGDFSYRDIALILGAAEGAVKYHIARGLGQLREILSGRETYCEEWDLSSTLLMEQAGP
ncbi:MAG TPA: RNA polymerase sigma factor [Verrucomicrobiae bacterium]|nr:RNA polymerase sigma factor [Verrucomicrobiae bacterium]